jgi:predicted acyl esterase
MKKLYFLCGFISCFFISATAQNLNGKLDDLTEFSTKYTVPFVMPDGVKLMTDIYVPKVRDSLVVSINLGDLIGISGIPPADITFIPLGSQIIIYDSINGDINPNPYQLPTVFTRTPYNKGGFDEVGGVLPILGYNYMLQDMRGRYSSEGVYFPMYSDSWNKNAYHVAPHVLDYLPPSDPRYSNRHEDGYHSVRLIQTLDSAYLAGQGVQDLSQFYAGLPHTSTKVNNGSIGMFGASALGNTQLQLGLAHSCPDSLPDLKCLMPIVATTEHYISTGYNNGVFRDRIVTGWLKGQIFSGTDDDLIPQDDDKQNSIHSSYDYALPKTISLNGVSREYQMNKFEAANLSIDHFTAMRYPRFDGTLSPAGYYPNSVNRADMDGSVAYVNQWGEAVNPITQTPLPNLNYSRYRNLDVGVYHVTGWWDIFTEGQINTINFTQHELSNMGSTNANLQKIIIGPWAHQTIASRETGDRFYPKNVTDITKIDISEFNIDNIPLDQLVASDIITWFRYNLNYNADHNVGEPKFFIKESQQWQVVANIALLGEVKIRVPSEDFKVPFVDMINFLSGKSGLNGLKIEYQVGGLGVSQATIDVPAVDAILPSIGGQPLTEIPKRDFKTEVPTFRYYVPGPDSAADAAAGFGENYKVGNYWMESEVFPPYEHIRREKWFMHQDGSFNLSAPTADEGYKMYVHDPDDPILTVGGNNMIVRSPDGTRNSQGQMELTDTSNARYTMDREGVIQFSSAPIQDSFTIMGFPVCTLYAKTNPGGVEQGPTDTDWFVRLCDEFPDGRVYFVQEGCVNSRGRDYARSLIDGVESPEDREIPFTNINVGETYEFAFKFQPIAYSFAAGHKMRVLISSSNYTRYQVNPNLPINDGEFFRRKPGDGQFYTFNGEQMLPRVAVQRVHFSPENATSIDFPVYEKDFINSIPQVSGTSPLDITVFPNPSSENIQIFSNKPGKKELTIMDIAGRVVYTGNFDDNIILNVNTFGKGIYFATATSTGNTAERVTEKFIVQ